MDVEKIEIIKFVAARRALWHVLDELHDMEEEARAEGMEPIYYDGVHAATTAVELQLQKMQRGFYQPKESIK